MKYIILIFDRDDWWESASEEEQAKAIDAHGAFGAYLEARGGEVSGAALQSGRTAASVRRGLDGEDALVTDGPFVDLKEALGGFYIIEATDLAEAVEVGKRCPAEFGVEVRPLVTFADDGEPIVTGADRSIT